MAYFEPIVRLNNYNLHDRPNGRYITELNFQNSNSQKLDIFSVTKSDRHKITAGWPEIKQIQITGVIDTTNNTDITAQMDALKAAVVGLDMDLFFSDGVNHRIWNTFLDGEVQTDYNKVYTRIEYSFKLLIADPIYGIEADSSGNRLNTVVSLALNSIQNVFTVNFGGSANAQPILQFTLSSATTPDITAIEILNRETGQSMSISFAGLSPANGDVLLINTLRAEVLFRGRPIAYDGVIPSYVVGNNELEVFYVTANSNIQVAAQKVVNDYEVIRTNVRTAQAFTPASGQNVAFASVALSKVGNPTGAVRVGIMADSAGNPSGTYLGLPVDIDIATIREKARWFTVALAGVGITAGSPIWLVIDAPSSTAGQVNFVKALKSRIDQGFGLLKNWNGSSWVNGTGDLAFKVYTSNSTAQNQTIDTQTYTNPFSATTDRDNVNNTALWLTGDGTVTMTGIAALDQSYTVNAAGVSGLISDPQNGFGSYKFLAQSFVPSVTRGIDSLNLLLKAYSNVGAANGWSVFAELRTDSGGNPGSVIATSLSATTDTTWQTDKQVGFAFPTYPLLTSGVTYWIVLQTNIVGNNNYPTVEWRGGSTSGYASGVARGSAGSGWSAVSVNDFWFEVYNRRFTTTENAVINQVNTRNADIISVSHSPITILLGGSTYQGQISANNGTNYQNIARDISAFQTETIPSVIGAALKWRGQLASTDNVRPFIDSLSLSWREGIALDATTKFASQSFSPTATGSVTTAKLRMMKLGSPGNLTVRVETDSAGSPSGTLVNANATATVTAASISGTGFSLVDVAFTGSFSLTAGVTYHLVIRPSATANDANKVVLDANFGRYSGFEMRRSLNSGSTYSGFTSGTSGFDLVFGIYGSGGFSFTCNLDITYNRLWL